MQLKISDLPVPSATTLMLDLMSTRVPPSFSLRQLCRAAEVFEIGDGAVRSAISRLKREGRIAVSGRGMYQIGERGLPIMQQLLQWPDALNQRSEWQGHWVIAFANPQDRNNRTTWRRTLSALNLEGLVEAEKNIWVRPDNLKGGVARIRQSIARMEGSPSLLLVKAAELDLGRAESYARLWNSDELDELDIAWRKLLSDGLLRLRSQSPVEACRDSLLLGRESIRHILRDPRLPESIRNSRYIRELIDTARLFQKEAIQIWLDYLDIR